MRNTISSRLALVLAFGLVAALAGAAPASIDVKKIPPSFLDWDGQYNEILGSWTFMKFTTSDDGEDQTSTFYVDTVPNGDVPSFDEYAKNLTKKDWLDLLYVWTKIESKEKTADGFVFIGKNKDYKDSTAKEQPSFVVVRKFKNTALVCKGDAATPALLAEAVDFCKKLK